MGIAEGVTAVSCSNYNTCSDHTKKLSQYLNFPEGLHFEIVKIGGDTCNEYAKEKSQKLHIVSKFYHDNLSNTETFLHCIAENLENSNFDFSK